jgi:hypothetical protein
MIFARIAVAAVVATALIVVLGPGGPDPALALEARRLVVARATEADAALADLEGTLADVLTAGREGVARTAAGDLAPGPAFIEAADLLDAAGDTADRADRAVRALGAARVAGTPDGRPIQASVSPDELAAISIELRTLAASADAFADIRGRAEGVGALMAEALERTEAGDLAAAEAAVEQARADYAIVAEWESGLTSLPVWVETTGELLEATEDLVAAAGAGDRSAALEAAERVAALEADAVFADRALRIAMSEGASFASEGPLAALAEAERRTSDTRDHVALIMQTVGR